MGTYAWCTVFGKYILTLINAIIILFINNKKMDQHNKVLLNLETLGQLKSGDKIYMTSGGLIDIDKPGTLTALRRWIQQRTRWSTFDLIRENILVAARDRATNNELEHAIQSAYKGLVILRDRTYIDDARFCAALTILINVIQPPQN
jgi:hypothetical protein